MNRNISINVDKKLASVIGAPVIICGNSDYHITFTFDEEWETLDLKTARFVYKRDGKLRFVDVVFSGRTTAVPVLSNIDEVYVGVYSGELHTTTPARIICKKSILCGDSTQHEVPDPDVYQQILEAFNNLETLPTVGAADAGRALMVNEDGHWVARTPDFMHDQNSGDLIRFFFGTSEEWDAWTGDKNGVLFCPTDDATLEALDEAVTALPELKTTVGEHTEKLNEQEKTLSDMLWGEMPPVLAWAAESVKEWKVPCEGGTSAALPKPGIYFCTIGAHAAATSGAQCVLCIYDMNKSLSTFVFGGGSDNTHFKVNYSNGKLTVTNSVFLDVHYIPFFEEV